MKLLLCLTLLAFVATVYGGALLGGGAYGLGLTSNVIGGYGVGNVGLASNVIGGYGVGNVGIASNVIGGYGLANVGLASNVIGGYGLGGCINCGVRTVGTLGYGGLGRTFIGGGLARAYY